MFKVSIIIPTLNEKGYLAKLLSSLVAQTVAPYEVIIVDSHSQDGTFADIKKYCDKLPLKGVSAPRGIGMARNLGAQLAGGDLFLFLDSDVELEPDFIKKAIPEFNARNLDIASAHLYIDKNYGAFDRFGAWLMSKYFSSFQFGKNPHGSGFCLLVRRDLHQKLKGFNEQYRHSEDHDYVKRAVQLGATFRLLKTVRFKLSNRRYERDGRLAILSIYAKAEANRIFFNYKYAPREQALYDFGAFTKQKHRRAHITRK